MKYTSNSLTLFLVLPLIMWHIIPVRCKE